MGVLKIKSPTNVVYEATRFMNVVNLNAITDIDTLLNGGYGLLNEFVCQNIQSGNYIYIGG